MGSFLLSINLPYQPYHGELLHKGDITCFDYESEYFTASTSLADTGQRVTIPANCAFSISVAALYNNTAPLSVAIMSLNSINYQLATGYRIPDTDTVTASCTYSSFTTTEKTFYIWAKYGNTTQNCVHVSGFYVKIA